MLLQSRLIVGEARRKDFREVGRRKEFPEEKELDRRPWKVTRGEVTRPALVVKREERARQDFLGWF